MYWKTPKKSLSFKPLQKVISLMKLLLLMSSINSNSFIIQAIAEGYILDETIAIDATHFEARDQAPPKEDKPKPEPKKRGRKSKAKREQWLKEQAEKEANLPIYEKKIEAQLDISLTE